MTRCPVIPRGTSGIFNKAEYARIDRRYDQGGHTVPRSHIKDPVDVLNWPDMLRLPDGRPIKLVYDRQTYTATSLREVADQLVSLV